MLNVRGWTHLNRLLMEDKTMTQAKHSKLWEGADSQLDYYKGDNMNKTGAKHTPTPWRVIDELRNSNKELLICGDEAVVCQINAYPHYNKGDADFIVRSVNSHEALVEACKKVTKRLCDMGDLSTFDNGRKLSSITLLTQALKQAEGK